MWTTDGVNIYFGDCQAGDRAATDTEIAAWQASRTATSLRTQAQAALDKTSVTIERIAEGVALGTCAWTNPDVVAFMGRRKKLRAIVSGNDTTSTTLPDEVPFPAGT